MVVDALRLSAVQGDERAEIVAFVLEVFRRAVEDDLSVFKKHDAIEALDACEMVRDDDQGSICERVEQNVEELVLCFRVERGERFIDYDNGVVCHEDAR